MVDDVAVRRPNARGKVLRRRRIFARLREGWVYEEIAAAEGLTATRIRQIVSEVLQKRVVDSRADHANLQLDRLTPAIQLGAEAIAAGDVSAISPYLKALDRLDRYQTVVGANQGYNDEARKKLMAKINRIAANLGVDETWEAARDYLVKHGRFPAHPDQLREAEPAEEPAGLAEADENLGGPREDPSAAAPDGRSEAAQWMSIRGPGAQP